MGCPFCGLVFNAGLSYGAGTVAGACANHIRVRHPKEAFLMSLVGGTLITYLITRMLK
jgi:hypothetical protein